MILDNYSAHKHPKVNEWLEERPKYHPHFTPTSASWLNQVEIWFGILTHRQIGRGVFKFKSVAELVTTIEKYIKTHNEDTTPFLWTKTRKQILVKAVRDKDISVTGQYVPESREYPHNSILPASSDKLPYNSS